ncbi:Metacaspase-1 [Diplonema papillatum]|nr:Metacaspase-1 [Diplonema papillatum]KAJ9469329.1 Metacaspase-1 [Diplonema papillatum]
MFGSLFKKGWDSYNTNQQEANQQALGGLSTRDYETKARDAIPAEVLMFSGCKDSQTSADVSNVQSFGLPEDSGPGGAGGACTNALLKTAYLPGDCSWVELLTKMRDFLGQGGYSQVPQLSTSREVDLNSPFEIAGGYSGYKKSVLVGINYVEHSSGRLSGCINDVVSMKNFIASEGFVEDPSCMRILVDDHNDPIVHEHIRLRVEHPSRAGIMDAISWLVDGAQPGDVLFFHYSGHGGQQADSTGDEKDGQDETLIPEDYRSAGVITDDELLKELVLTVPCGVRLVCVMDCCHSGTILDLPFLFAATDNNIAAVQSGESTTTIANPGFHAQLQKLLKFGMEHLSKVQGAEGLAGMAESFGIRW